MLQVSSFCVSLGQATEYLNSYSRLSFLCSSILQHSGVSSSLWEGSKQAADLGWRMQIQPLHKGTLGLDCETWNNITIRFATVMTTSTACVKEHAQPDPVIPAKNEIPNPETTTSGPGTMPSA
jgi:hypothetical protein